MDKKPVKRTWTAIVASYEETMAALQGVHALEFPLIAIPWGAEREGTNCMAFWSADDISRARIDALLVTAYPFQGAPRLHLVTVKSDLVLPVWGVRLNSLVFKLPQF